MNRSPNPDFRISTSRFMAGTEAARSSLVFIRCVHVIGMIDGVVASDLWLPFIFFFVLRGCLHYTIITGFEPGLRAPHDRRCEVVYF
jgi:hypothetical protein